MKSALKKDSIRIDTGAKRIEVNDNGEYIVLNFADQSFPPRFYNMLEDFKRKQEDFKNRAEKIDSDQTLSEDERNESGFQLNMEIHSYFREQVDKLLGSETCRKVFGDIIPSYELFAEFFEKLTPFFEEYAKDREKKIAKKYNPSRSGNV